MDDDHERFVAEMAAYALDALDSRGRARVAAHLRHCAACRQLRDEYHATLSLLPYALTPELPPADARTAVLAGLRRGGPRQARTRDAVASLCRRMSRLLRPLRRPAVAVLLGGLLLWNVRLQLAARDNPAAVAATVERMARLPHGRIGPLIGAGAARDASGRLYIDEDGEGAALAVTGLPALPAGRVYQLWFIAPDRHRVSGGVFRVDARGQAALVVRIPQATEPYLGIAITDEPEPGSAVPTAADVLIGTT